MTRLSVNINKLATLRNARGGGNPNVLDWARSIQSMGAHGITVHPRPDERHITRQDAYALRDIVHTEYNIEGYPSADFVNMVLEIIPEQVTLVPDGPDVLTSNKGWDVIEHHGVLKEHISRFKAAGIRTSLFMDADKEQIAAVSGTGADRIELYTEEYARNYASDKEAALKPYHLAAEMALSQGLGLNAGHDLDLDNLAFFAKEIPSLLEVSIGHALICDALRYGMDNTVDLYLKQLDAASS